MMELGATVCTVHQPPNCAECPIRLHCSAYSEVQAHAAAGGDLADAPSVMAYPGKVMPCLAAAQQLIPTQSAVVLFAHICMHNLQVNSVIICMCEIDPKLCASGGEGQAQ